MSYAALGSQSEDMDAINTYIMTTPIVTDQARQLRDAWLSWYDALSWYAKDYDTATYDDARNKRNQFSLANTQTAAQKQAVQNVIKTGQTTEVMQGGTTRQSSSGQFPGSANQPLMGTGTKIVLAVAIGAGLYAYFGWIKPGMRLLRRHHA